MLCIYWADITGLTENYEAKLNTLHQTRAEGLNRYKMPEDRVRGLGAGLLLERGLEDYMGRTGHKPLAKDAQGRYIIEYAYGPQGKPSLKEYPDIYFSLSHSGTVAVLAVADAEVGIDVQKMLGYKDKIAKRFYHAKEQAYLAAVTDEKAKEELFYKIWSCKEGYIKYTGKGMSEELAGFYANESLSGIYSDTGEKLAGCQVLICGADNCQMAVVFHKSVTNIDNFIKISL